MFCHELLKTLVVEYKLVSYEYFMTELEVWEGLKLLDFVRYSDRNLQQLFRYQLWVMVQSNSKKQLSPEEVLKLPWDETHESPVEITEEAKEKLKINAAKFAELLSKNNEL